MHYAIDFAPHISPALLWILIAASVALTVLAIALSARGAWARGLAFGIVLLALAAATEEENRTERHQELSKTSDTHGEASLADLGVYSFRRRWQSTSYATGAIRPPGGGGQGPGAGGPPGSAPYRDTGIRADLRRSGRDRRPRFTIGP